MLKAVIFFAVGLSLAVVATDGMFVGGQSPIDIADERIVSASKVAVAKSSTANGSPCPEAFVLVNATKQVVAGTKYTMTYLITADKCPNNSKGNLEDGKVCTISVWSKPWEKFIEVGKDKCSAALSPKVE